MNSGINTYQKYLSLSRLDNIVIPNLVYEYGDEVLLVATFVRVLIITNWVWFCCAEGVSQRTTIFSVWGVIRWCHFFADPFAAAQCMARSDPQWCHVWDWKIQASMAC